VVEVLFNHHGTGARHGDLRRGGDLPYTTGVQRVAITDISGDGRPDLVVARTGSSRIAVLRNTTVLPNPTTPSFRGRGILHGSA
jgi:hypothetical protein